jgi:hypothetical protein
MEFTLAGLREAGSVLSGRAHALSVDGDSDSDSHSCDSQDFPKVEPHFYLEPLSVDAQHWRILASLEHARNCGAAAYAVGAPYERRTEYGVEEATVEYDHRVGMHKRFRI